MRDDSPQQVYSRREVRRLLALRENQLRGWEQRGLIPPRESYRFSDLLALRTLATLRANKVPATRIRQALTALRARLRDVTDPLVELKLFTDGRKIRVQVGRQQMEPVSGQLLLDFGEAELKKLVSFPTKGMMESRAREIEKRHRAAEHWFHKALEMEQTGAPADEAIRAYRQAIEADPKFAAALVNLGTIYYTARDLAGAEHYYRQALAADPDYALAHFNLGNLFDEAGKRAEALEQYQAALQAQPHYADAHYNIALLYQTSGQLLKALRHWKTYLKLDPVSTWAAIARRELDNIYRNTVVQTGRNRNP